MIDLCTPKTWLWSSSTVHTWTGISKRDQRNLRAWLSRGPVKPHSPPHHRLSHWHLTWPLTPVPPQWHVTSPQSMPWMLLKGVRVEAHTGDPFRSQNRSFNPPHPHLTPWHPIAIPHITQPHPTTHPSPASCAAGQGSHWLGVEQQLSQFLQPSV